MSPALRSYCFGVDSKCEQAMQQILTLARRITKAREKIALTCHIFARVV
jgi:hypothetical protein